MWSQLILVQYQTPSFWQQRNRCTQHTNKRTDGQLKEEGRFILDCDGYVLYHSLTHSPMLHSAPLHSTPLHPTIVPAAHACEVPVCWDHAMRQHRHWGAGPVFSGWGYHMARMAVKGNPQNPSWAKRGTTCLPL